jgi:biopolymer transport protein ExbD
MNFRPAGSRNKPWVTATLDITPLVDVIFQLLIFFFYTANFIQNPNIQVNLPRASADNPSSDRRDKIITITKDGRLVFEAKSYDLKGLKVRLARLGAEKPETKLLIRSDSGSQVGRLVEVIEAARAAGLRRFGIATRSASGVLPPPSGMAAPPGPAPTPAPAPTP